jgi:hypothetical protein
LPVTAGVVAVDGVELLLSEVVGAVPASIWAAGADVEEFGVGVDETG